MTRRTAVAEPPEDTEALRQQAIDRLTAGEMDRIRQETEAEHQVPIEARQKTESIEVAQREAKAAIEARTRLIPEFMEALATVAGLAEELKAARNQHRVAFQLASRLGVEVETWPYPPFGIDRHEAEVLRNAIMEVGDVGGRV